MSEYHALRASVLRRWAETGHDGEATEITRFNEAIDESLTEATLEYSAMLERTRDQFTGILGHDLRNPLGTIVVGAKLLTTDASQDWETRVARRILGAANRMTRMVADLLDLTRTQLGTGLPVTLRPMDVGPVCDQVIAELESTHPGRKVHCEHKGVLLGEWDADRLYQAITNLVVNALEHGSRTGAVAVIAQEQGEELVLSVHNEGEPIPEAMLEQIFEPMVAKDSEGLGLGLFIARQVAIAHGGTLTVASTEKKGTTFTMTLPRRPPTKTVPRRADSRPPPSPVALPSASPEAQLATQSEAGFTLPTRARKARPRPHKGETPGRSA